MSSYYLQFLDHLYGIQMPIIESLQKNFEAYDEQIISISEFARPDYVITIIFPIIAAFNTMLAAELVFANLIGNWSNIVLKWIFNEDRPFWWIKEFEPYKSSIELRQFHITCETGPGFPSGHVTSTSCTLFVLGYFLYCRKKSLKFLLWGCYLVALLLVSISRFYVLAHFPHQTIIGALMGGSFAYYAIKPQSKYSNWKKSSQAKMFMLALYCAFVTFATYWIMKLFGLDPQSSIKLAFKWCEQPENIHVTTTPFYGVINTIGGLTGFAVVSPIFNRIPSGGLNSIIGVAITLTSSASLFLIQQNIPTYSALVFYAAHFGVSFIQPILLLGLIPKLAGLGDQTKRD